MTLNGKLTKMFATISVAALGLTACASDEEQNQESGQGHQLETLLATDARSDQRAAGAGANMAMELGFDQVQPATDEALGAVRESAEERAGSAEEMTVNPQSCASPIEALDWSPILASSDSMTRVDFGRENFSGVGSIEVAGISEDAGGEPEAADQVAAHQQAVEEITTTCNDLTMMLADDSEPEWAELEYTFTAEPIETESGSGLLWERYPTEGEGGQSTTALTVMTDHEGHVIMVAFIGSGEIADDEFQDISEAILASAVGQLE
ncbi:hypothetical protein [Yaniella halotolerans]|uniref:hypothetical protein n=1 Tax=Yaniella halotolerans TaxID=225453 RepID=UPI0003B5E989|nr:hypothetical protein [Yaniella halotolerans]